MRDIATALLIFGLFGVGLATLTNLGDRGYKFGCWGAILAAAAIFESHYHIIRDFIQRVA